MVLHRVSKKAIMSELGIGLKLVNFKRLSVTNSHTAPEHSRIIFLSWRLFLYRVQCGQRNVPVENRERVHKLEIVEK